LPGTNDRCRGKAIHSASLGRHYLKKVPTGPFTQKEDWVPLFRDVAVAPEQTVNGIDDVHSASGEIANNGTAYNTR
jgi:hypothetical protein